MLTDRQSLAHATPHSPLSLLSGGIDISISMIFLFLFPEEVALFSVTSKKIQDKIPKNYWEAQLIKLGVDEELICQAKREPTVNYRRWYGAWKMLFIHAPGNACVPKDTYYYDKADPHYYYSHQEADWRRADSIYPISQRPKFLQVVLSGCEIDSPIFKEINKEYWIRALICDGYRGSGANVLHYAAWSGSYKTLTQALSKYPSLKMDFASATLLLCAERSGAVQTDEQRVAVLSACIASYYGGSYEYRLSPINNLLKYFSLHSGTNLLHDAAKRGSIVVLRFFEGKISASSWLIPSRCGATVLHYAAQHAAQSGSTEVIEFLYSLNVGLTPNARDNAGKTAADWAAENISADLEGKQDIEQAYAHAAGPVEPVDSNNSHKNNQQPSEEEKQEPTPQPAAARSLLNKIEMALDLEGLQRITREKKIKTIGSLVIGSVVSAGISYALTGTVLLSVCCAGAVGALLIALMVHSAYHGRVSFFHFQSPEAHKRENKLLNQRTAVHFSRSPNK